MTVTEWLIEECRRRLAIADREAPEAPGQTFMERIDDLPGRYFKDAAAVREYGKRRYRTGSDL